MPQSHPIELRLKIVAAHTEQGIAPAQVARIFGVSYRTVKRYLAKASEGHSLEPGIGTGRPRLLADYDLAWIRQFMEDAPFSSSHEVAHAYNRAHGTKIHRSTFLRALHDLGLSFKKKRPSHPS